MTTHGPDIIIIGGGAAGLAAAISAAQSSARDTVLETAKRVGQKILKTGNGRCNLTNMHVAPCDYNSPDFVAPVITALPASQVLRFFDALGLMTFEESQGRVYPLSNAANSVLDTLRNACARLGVNIECEREATGIKAASNGTGYQLACSDGSSWQASRVIIATGGGTRLLEQLGHRIEPFAPVLCPLKTDTTPLKGLSGVRAHALVRAYRDANANESIACEEGEVLFRDYGVSGIVIFDMSRFANSGDWLALDFLPFMGADEFADWLAGALKGMRAVAGDNGISAPSLSELMTGVFQRRVNDAIIRAAGYRPADPANEEALPTIAAAAKDFRLQVMGPGDAKQAQVTRGGAALDEFDATTLESKLAPGVFACGETLDIDARCGGYSLHWAWASGITAGKETAR